MLYSCKPLFEKIKAQVGAEIDNFPIEDPPRVCIITTGEDEPSARYVRNKLKEDHIHPDCMAEMNIEEGWCKYMVRSDWENTDGPYGSYYVEKRSSRPVDRNGKPAPGWFPVWIVRQEEWY